MVTFPPHHYSSAKKYTAIVFFFYRGCAVKTPPPQPAGVFTADTLEDAEQQAKSMIKEYSEIRTSTLFSYSVFHRTNIIFNSGLMRYHAGINDFLGQL